MTGDAGAPLYRPPDASRAPRYTGIRTFARCPHVRSTDPVAVAVVGVPFDSAASHHAGARFGPEAIRAGFSPLHGMLAFLRALAGMRCMGFDMDEVSPSHGGPGQRTAMLAANVAYESLALSALAGERS